jgi:hypothetical protein
MSAELPKTRETVTDLAYGVGLHQTMTVVNAAQLDIPHPRRSSPSTYTPTPGYRVMRPSSPEQPSYLGAILILESAVTLEERGQIDYLRTSTHEMAIRAEQNLGRLSVISSSLE